MAAVREQRGDVAEATRLLAEAIAEAGEKVPVPHPAAVRAALVQARLDVRAGRAAAAVDRLGTLLENARTAGASTSVRAALQRHRAEALLAAGRIAEARADAQAAVAVFDRMRGDRPHSCDLAVAWWVLARALGASGDAQAREFAVRAVESLRATVDPASPELRDAIAYAETLAR
jgi:hypothetical protein